MQRWEKIGAAPLELSARLAKPLSNPWRNRILAEVALRPMSPKQFTVQVKGPELEIIARYFRELRDWGFLEVAEERRGGKRRGGGEKIYQAIQRIYFDTPTWEKLPYYLRCECSMSMVDGLIARITESVRAGIFDAEKDRHLSWKTICLDRQAWSAYSKGLDDVLTHLGELEAQSADRILHSNARSLLVTTGLIAFRVPPADAKLPPVTPPPKNEGLR